MAPVEIRLELQTVGKATGHPELQRIVRRIARRLIAHNWTETYANSASVNLRATDAALIKPDGLSDRQSGARRDVIVGQARPPYVPTLVPDIRGFDHGVLCKLVGDSEVILP